MSAFSPVNPLPQGISSERYRTRISLSSGVPQGIIKGRGLCATLQLVGAECQALVNCPNGKFAHAQVRSIPFTKVDLV
jgi:hypothetical protein